MKSGTHFCSYICTYANRAAIKANAIRTLLCCLAIVSSSAFAGYKLSGELGASALSFRAKKGETTPNYYSLSPGFSLGYSDEQVFDGGFFFRYYPGSYGQIKLKTDLTILYYGVQASAWFKEEVVIGGRAGFGNYQATKHNIKNEVPGRWEGLGGSVFLGTLFKITKSQFIELSFEYTQLQVKPKAGTTEKLVRTIDVISLNLNYTFNHFVRYLLENSLFRSVFSQ
jgi:hypothetical protein